MNYDTIAAEYKLLKKQEEESYINIDSGSLVKDAYKAIKCLTELRNNIFKDLCAARSIYWDNVRYYKQYGGAAPSFDAVNVLQDQYNDLKEIIYYIKDTIQTIIKNNWYYTTSFNSFIKFIITR